MNTKSKYITLMSTDFPSKLVLDPITYNSQFYSPITSAWEGGVNFVRTNPRYGEYFVTREQFEEFGDFICLKKFSWLL